ncbi:MAG: RNHCP domain-containing protein [Candidatus Gracilibacteria bacterium]
MNKRFQKNVEDFTCERCGHEVKGGGYTNHCPICLWSKHVDVNPGDRQSTCQGMMKPVGIETKAGGHVIVHRCESCHLTKRNKASKDDDINAIINLSSNPVR